MKYIQLAQGQVLFRAHNPRWAHVPLSGAGAALAGGRFNRPGVNALYLSFELETAAAEYRQDNDITDPFLMVAYRACLPPLVDLRQRDAGWDRLWQDWDCDWRALYVNGVEPPSWALGDLLLEADAPGLVFPSTIRQGGTNVMLHTDLIEAGQLLPHDPLQLLPRNPASWQARKAQPEESASSASQRA